MGGRIVVMEPAEYERWLTGGSAWSHSGSRRGGLRPIGLQYVPQDGRDGPRSFAGRTVRPDGEARER